MYKPRGLGMCTRVLYLKREWYEGDVHEKHAVGKRMEWVVASRELYTSCGGLQLA